MGRGTEEDLSVGREEVSSRRERGQTTSHIRQEGQVRETLDVGLELFPNLGHSRQFLFILLQKPRRHNTCISSKISYSHHRA